MTEQGYKPAATVIADRHAQRGISKLAFGTVEDDVRAFADWAFAKEGIPSLHILA